MRLALFTLFVFATYGCITAFRHPSRSYGYYPDVYNPSQQEEAQARQLFWSIKDFITVNVPRNTLRATFTSVVDMTCTKSVARACRVNQRPFIRTAVMSDIFDGETNEAEEDDTEQFSVAPTGVERVEATPVPTRQARAADPQYFVNPRAYENQLRNIQSAFYSDDYDPLSMSLYESYPPPTAGQRQLFSGLLTATTIVSTVLKINTVTQTPRCSKAGPIPQCPNA